MSILSFGHDITRRLTLSATPWVTENIPDLPVGKEVPSRTSSDESLAWAVQQLQTCKQSHKACNSFPAAPLPSRVLDVAANSGSGSGVRLYVSEGETDPYIALSHCWGHKPFLRTLSGSLDAHRSEIVWARLPQTFQDAVEFTRKLGIRYLWIDSLCIVQDDQQDWRREAAKMASVYQGATLVISAAKSEGAYGGLYADLPDKYRTYTVRFPGQSDDDGDDDDDDPSFSDDDTVAEDTTQPHPSTKHAQQQIHLRPSLSHPHRLLSPYHASTSTLPIFTRGWILQERFLSPRLLHFGPEELSFECLESTACQCTASSSTVLPDEVKLAPAWYTHMLDRTARPKHYYSLAAWVAGLDGGDNGGGGGGVKMGEKDLWVVWRRLVEDYTHLRLTVEGDIFPAISGMAQQMMRVRPGTSYVAGLWEDTLLLGDLLWYVELPPGGYLTSKEAAPSSAVAAGADGKDAEAVVGGRWAAREGPGWRCRPARWRAPSWSWAAVSAPVCFLNMNEGIQPEGEVVDVQCEVVPGGGLTGELREGGSWLVLKGRLIPALMRFNERKQGEETEPWNVVDLDILDGGHMKNLRVDDDCKWLVPADGGQPRVFCLVVGRKLPRKELLCLLLTRVPQEDGPVARDQPLHGDGHLYRRIGMLEVFGGPPSPVLWGWLHNLLGKGEDAVVKIV